MSGIDCFTLNDHLISIYIYDNLREGPLEQIGTVYFLKDNVINGQTIRISCL